MQPGSTDAGGQRARQTTFYRSGLLELQSNAWTLFDREVRPRLIRLGLLRGLKPSEAEEIAQHTLCDFLEAVDQHRFSRSRGGVRVFLYRIARCRIADHYRRAASAPTSASTLEPQIEALPIPSEASLQEDEQLERCLALLENTASERDRRVFYLRYRHSCSIEVIAEIVGCSRNDVSQRLCRTRSRLRELLRDAHEQRV